MFSVENPVGLQYFLIGVPTALKFIYKKEIQLDIKYQITMIQIWQFFKIACSKCIMHDTQCFRMRLENSWYHLASREYQGVAYKLDPIGHNGTKMACVWRWFVPMLVISSSLSLSFSSAISGIISIISCKYMWVNQNRSQQQNDLAD